MSLSDLASIGNLVSGVAVLASLVFFFFQLRQMAKQMKQSEKIQLAQIRQTQADRRVDVLFTRLDPSVAMAVRKGLNGDQDISAVELEQFTAYVQGALVSWKEAFDQYGAGFIHAAEFADLEANIRQTCTLPGMRIFRQTQMRNSIGKDFMDWVDRLMSERAVAASRSDRLAEWKRAAAALKAQ